MFTLYYADIKGNAGNCLYSHKIVVKNKENLKLAVSKDYVCAQYKNNYRSVDNFIGSDCLAVDFDNDHSDDPTKWITPEDLKMAFPGVTIGIHYSRNNMKEKNGKAARQKFHAFFPIEYTTSKDEYVELKKRVNREFPYCDIQALDAARFFFGTDEAVVDIVEGNITLSEFLDDIEFDKDFDKIKEGSRNSTMSRFASRVLKKLGDTDEAYKAFLDKNEKCVPPLDDVELKTIWGSALKFFKKISANPDYIPSSQYDDPNSYKPADYTDVGQASVMAKYFSNELRYSSATHFIRYKENYWQESEPGSQAVAHELTRRQLNEAEKIIIKCAYLMKEQGIKDKIDGVKKDEIVNVLSEAEKEIYDQYMDALMYKKFVMQRRDSKYITATLKEARPMLEIDTKVLNSDPFLLNTPKATYDLRLGLAGAREHSSNDYITKITALSPSNKGKDIWLECLNKIFAKDPELIDYVQLICGLAVIGKVFVEAMVISYGEGGNGKSTFWNAVFRVLGNYSGKISADTLTVGCRRNVKPEMAEMNGRRLLIASESQEGARLNDSIVKQLCSTDEVFAEKKYKDPFYFTPCHTLILYTNHLPRVSGNDDGIWRRLIVIPFNNKLTGTGDIKNYADYLYENAGEYIMQWIIEGAQKVIALGYKINAPECVTNAVEKYRDSNDWFHHFLDDCCDVETGLTESSNDLYTSYRKYSEEMCEYVRSTTDFYAALENCGFKKIVKSRRKYIVGLRLKSEFEDFLD